MAPKRVARQHHRKQQHAVGFRRCEATPSGAITRPSASYALQLNTTGSYNTAVGYDALNANTTGTYNTAIGDGALQNNTTGSNNIAVGYKRPTTSRAATATTFTSAARASPATAASSASGRRHPDEHLHRGHLRRAIDTPNRWSASTPPGGSEPQLQQHPLLPPLQGADRRHGRRSSKLLQLRPVTFFYKPQYDDGSHAAAIRPDRRRSRQGLSRDGGIRQRRPARDGEVSDRSPPCC